MNTLFVWFNNRIAEIYGLTPSLPPAETLRQLGAPDALADMFLALADCDVILKDTPEGKVPDLEQREKKRKRSTGQFYTPENLAARLVEISEPGVVGDILDPACGDGSFLMAMAAHLQSLRSDCLQNKDLPSKNEFDPQIAQIPRIPSCHWSVRLKPQDGRMNECLGIESVQVLQDAYRHLAIHGLRSIRSQSIDSSTLGHPWPSRTKQSCLTTSSESLFLVRLHGYDIDIQALFVCLTRLICAFPGCGWPRLEQRDFLLCPPRQLFSVIIGNPPYRVNLDDSFKSQLSKLYETGEGEKDLYTFFIEGSLRALSPGGRLVMLTSHTYLVNHQCKRIRRFVFSKYHARALLMLPERFFAMAPGVLPVVLVADAAVPAVDSQLDVYADYSDSEGWQQCYRAPARLFEENSGLRQAIVPPHLQKVLSVMNLCDRLAKHCRVGVGIQESVKRDGKISRFVCDHKKSGAHRPVLRGRELAPFRINWDGNYIDYGPHLAYSGNEKIFAGPKILYQNIRNERLKMRLVAAFDRDGFFPKNSISYILPQSDEISEEFILGLMNSLLVNAWFSGNFHSFHVTVTQVRQIPLPACSKALRQKICELSVRLEQPFPDADTRHECYEQLNLLVCESYLGAGDHVQLLIACDKFLEQAAAL